jgi:hypothetical protein
VTHLVHLGCGEEHHTSIGRKAASLECASEFARHAPWRDPTSLTSVQQAQGIKPIDRGCGQITATLRVYPFDPLSAPGASLERISKVLCFPGNLATLKLHDADRIGRLSVIQDYVFANP